MSVKLELYRVFKVVHECGSISEAASKLFISQSAVSQAVKQLEEQLSCQLLIRTPKGVIPTNEGQMLYEYASSAIELISVAEQKLLAMQNLAYGDLKIGASDTISHYLLLPVLERFSRMYPKIKLQIVNRTSQEGAALLKSGKLDLVFVNAPFEDEELVITKYVDIEDIFVTSAGSTIDKQKQYTLEEISQLPLILLEKKANSRILVEDFFNKSGVKISPEIELGSHDLLLEFARINLGVSCVIREFSQDYISGGELVEIKTAPALPKRSIGAAFLKSVSPSTAARSFMELLKLHL